MLRLFAMLVLLFRDPLVRVAVAALVLQALFLWLLPAGPRATAALWSDSILLALYVCAAALTARAAASAREQRFWRLLAAAGLLWFLASLLDLVPMAARPGETLDLVTDALYLAITFLFIVALATRPDRGDRRGPLARALAIEHLGTAVFAFALLAYFVVVPFWVNQPIYATMVPSTTAFVLLDVFLAARAGWLVRAVPAGRWRAVYALFCASFAAALAHDGHELVAYLRELFDEPGGVWNLAWTAQFVALAAAAAAGRRIPVAVAAGPGIGLPARAPSPVTSLVPFTFALPLVHLVGRAAGLLDPVTEGARDILVLMATPVLGGLAIAHQSMLERRSEEVRRDLLAMQEELQESRKMEALGRLAGGVAHDFNNLLSVILGYSDMLLDRRRDDERVTRPVEEIRQAAERALSLTRQLTVFSQRQTVEGRPLSLDQAVAGLAPLLERVAGPGVALERRPGAAGRCTNVDLHQFERVLINLVVNAREAMPGGGRITIETSAVSWSDDDPERPRALRPGGYLQLVVRDTGTGMAPEVRARACDPFFTTKDKHEHPGLGLSVVYGIVMQAGGAIEIDSHPEAGTAAILIVPEVPAAETVEAEAPGAGLRQGQATVLVAEDDDSFRELMRVALESEGYQVLEAADGRAALDVGSRYEGRIDVLVTDLVMPSVDGRRLAERLMPGRPEMRVLFVSGYAGDLLSDLELPPGNRAFLQKPFRMTELVERVAEVSGVRPVAAV